MAQKDRFVTLSIAAWCPARTSSPLPATSTPSPVHVVDGSPVVVLVVSLVSR